VTTPLYIIPWWTSIYWTHPGALLSGAADGISLATESGYELHGGELQFNYYINHQYPKTTFVDLIDGQTTSWYPDPSVFTNTIAQNDGYNGGWDWNNDRFFNWTPDPFVQFSLLDLLTQNNPNFMSSSPYYHIDFLGEVDTSSLYN